nr:MAG TPA: hypothetical protein [Caudoviricetes sp.]
MQNNKKSKLMQNTLLFFRESEISVYFFMYAPFF